jgi:hypothetical protein
MAQFLVVKHTPHPRRPSLAIQQNLLVARSSVVIQQKKK